VGLITGILTLPLAPVRGVAWIGERVQEQAEAEFYDENRIMSELTELEEEKTSGEIGEDEFDRRVDELLERLEVGRQLQLDRGGYVG
jgi:ribosome assembly protein YihI (activator of Der GTPase)